MKTKKSKVEVRKIKDPIVQVIAEIGKIETQEDGLKMTVYTNEVAPEEMTVLMMLKNKQGNMLFAPASHDFTPEEIKDVPEIQLEEGETKTPSQRLRAVIYRVWERKDTKAKVEQTFEVYYRSIMERLIDKYKQMLD